MRRKTKATRRPILGSSRGRTSQEKFRALLQAGYAELGPETKRLEHEFAHLEADPVLKALWENERDAAYDRL
jgi:hypothetical protein